MPALAGPHGSAHRVTFKGLQWLMKLDMGSGGSPISLGKAFLKRGLAMPAALSLSIISTHYLHFRRENKSFKPH